MPINSSALATKQLTDQDTPTVIELLTSPPILSQALSPTRPPGQLVGFYNGTLGVVELYVVNNQGDGFLRVG